MLCGRVYMPSCLHLKSLICRHLCLCLWAGVSAGWISKRPLLALHLMLVQRARLAIGARVCESVCVCLQRKKKEKKKRALSFIRELRQKAIRHGAEDRELWLLRAWRLHLHTLATGWSRYTLEERCVHERHTHTYTHTLSQISTPKEIFKTIPNFVHLNWIQTE